jgi:hypothetical protein
MPLPVYIVCARSFSEDRSTGLVSFFHVVEGIGIAEIPQAGESSIPRDIGELRVIAAWMKGDEDSSPDEFEHQLVFHLPGASDPITTIIVRFRFAMAIHRFGFSTGAVFATFKAPGLVRIESRVRKVGSEAWLSQSFPIRVTPVKPLAHDG